MNAKKVLFLFVLTICFLHAQVTNAQQNDYNVLFHSGVQQLPENFKTDLTSLSPDSEEVYQGYYFRFVQFYQIPDLNERSSLEDMGWYFEAYVPHRTYLVAVPESFDWNQINPDYLRTVLAVDPSLKLDVKLQEEIAVNAQNADAQAEVVLSYSGLFEWSQIEEACLEQNISIMEASRYNQVVRAQIPLADIAETAALPFINFIEMAPPTPTPDDLNGRSLHRCNLVDTDAPSGYQFNGAGVNVQVRDDGGVGPHIDFQGRVDNSFQAGFPGSHATRVAGTLGGAGNIDPYAKGMADGAFIFGTDYESTFLDVSMDLHFNEGVVITNSSYSNGCNDGYMANSATVDEQIFDNPSLIHIFSAGNSNNSDCGYGAGDQWGNITGGHKVGKNVITTANIIYDGSIVSSSSRGPAEDGRLKPDISAQGMVYASLPGNDYTETNGTSFSSPSVAGVLAQLYQAYKTWNGGDNPPSALMKACLLNTANDLGNPGPDFIYGWGHLNAYRAMKTIEETRYFSDMIETGVENSHILTIPTDLRQIRIMAYWSDVPGTPFSAKALVNDLDIQLVTPTGDILLPYLLDPTPDPTILNTPAGNGVDNLNNVEQIVIDIPEAGDYTLLVNGTEVPMGPQEYFVLWEEVTDEIMVTHPVGGECFNSSRDQPIHWDAHGDDGEFEVQYSINGGSSWATIGTVSGTERNIDWDLPSVFTGTALVRVSRNGVSDQSDATFSIMDEPTNLDVQAVCPTYISLTWDPVPDATGYIAYVLGAQYMDSVGMTTTNSIDIPISNPTIANWYAISSIGPDGACSPRTIASLHDSGLFNCILNDDVSIGTGNICSGENYICEPFADPLTTSVTNNGLNAQSDIEVSYSLNNGPVITEVLAGPLMPGESSAFTFTDLLNPLNGSNTLKTWVSASIDEAAFNDTLSINFEMILVTSSPAALAYTEDFESGVFPPLDWELTNNDGGITWEPANVIGSSGGGTTAAFINNYSYNAAGQRDELMTASIDLTTAVDPFLSFDVASARFSANFADTLYVTLTTLCGDECASDIIYYKYSSELATVPDQGSSWEPNSADHWRNEVIMLDQYVGNQVLITFINATGYGNGLFIDNINLDNGIPPVANFDISQTMPCETDLVTFTDNSEGAAVSYMWDFGAGASPATAGSAGPHDVTYSSPGTKTISLTVSGPVGEDTFESMIEVAPQPVPSFTFTEMDATYTFTNTSMMGDTYMWDFGDGNDSSEENPVHTYTESGEYDIVLSVTNDCGTVTFTETVTVVIISTSDLGEQFGFDLSPNPGTDELHILLKNTPMELLQIQMYHANGKLVHTKELTSPTLTNYRITTADLPAGTYWVKLIFEDGAESRRWVKI